MGSPGRRPDCRYPGQRFAEAAPPPPATYQRDVLGHVRAALARSAGTGISHEQIHWAWTVTIGTAYDLGDIAAVRELLAMIDDRPPGHLAPMLLAERTLVHARLADRDGHAAAGPAFAAIGPLRDAADTAISEVSDVARVPPLPATAGPGRRPDARRTADRGPR